MKGIEFMFNQIQDLEFNPAKFERKLNVYMSKHDVKIRLIVL